MGFFFPLDFHFMVYFIIWEMHGFSHQFLITWEKTAKPIELEKSGKLVPSNIIQNHCIIVCGEPGKLVFILSPLYGCFFPLDSHPMVYFITWEMMDFLIEFPIEFEKSAKPIKWGRPAKLVFILFP